jgi:general secretion pathway protein B
MSILLDALRKSEEQRRLGSTPSIHDGSGAQRSGSEAGQQWIPFALIALSVVAIAWIGWQQYGKPPADAASETAINVQQDEGPAGPDSGGNSAPAPGANQPGTPVESYVAEVRPPQAHSGPPGQDQRERVSQSFQAYEGGDEPPGEEEAVAASPDTVIEPPPAGRRAAAATSSSRRSEPDQPAESEPITFWELPQGVRDSLPELRITVLVYAESPEDRFVLVSGQRLVEKDEVDSGVVLDEIRRDGAVFLFRNYRFLVKG